MIDKIEASVKTFSRPRFPALLILVIVAGFSLAACGDSMITTSPSQSAAVTTQATSTTQSAVTTQNSTTASTTTVANTQNANPATGTPATNTTVATTTTGDTSPKVVAAANAFLATLDSTKKAAVLFDYTNTAQKQRWSNFPNAAFSRAGLMWGNLTDAQKQAWLAVMTTTLSKEGYQRVLNEWNADDALAATDSGGGNANFGTNYY